MPGHPPPTPCSAPPCARTALCCSKGDPARSLRCPPPRLASTAMLRSVRLRAVWNLACSSFVSKTDSSNLVCRVFILLFTFRLLMCRSEWSEMQMACISLFQKQMSLYSRTDWLPSFHSWFSSVMPNSITPRQLWVDKRVPWSARGSPLTDPPTNTSNQRLLSLVPHAAALGSCYIQIKSNQTPGRELPKATVEAAQSLCSFHFILVWI